VGITMESNINTYFSIYIIYAILECEKQEVPFQRLYAIKVIVVR
jgi:hypothetical protein